MMAAPPLPTAPTLPRLPKVAAETSFDALRADGIHRVQALAGARWTDYNLHDPGVTLLEAACYALTELAYRVDFPVADHLSDAQDRIAWSRHGLLLPQRAFPCRPTTATDLRRMLLDRLPVLDGVTLQTDAPTAAGAAPAGVMHLLLDAGDGADANALVHAVRRACAAQRNLGEDLGEVRLMQRHACTLCGEIAIGGSREPAEIVAELLESCSAYLASTVDFDSVQQALAEGQTLDRVFEGPTTLRGIAQPHRLQRALEPTLFITDLIARVRATPGVLDVGWLALRTPDGRLETSSLPWRDLTAGWTLALDPPAADGGYADLVVRRRGNLVDLSARELRRRLVERRAGRLARRHGQAAHAAALAPPAGRHQPAPGHFPLQDHLPPVYAVGEHGLPASATEPERARARQLQGYLSLFDQTLAHGAAQVAGLRDLFATDRNEQASYLWHVLGSDDRGEEDVPGLASLTEATPAEIEQQVCQPFDDATERRSRLLDLLLALHGQNYPQHSLRQFCDHLAPREREQTLLRNKLRFLREIAPPHGPPDTPQQRAEHLAQPLLNRDRAGGFDWTRPSWNRPGNSSALQRRVGLLLGFDHDDLPLHSRPLASGLQRRELVDTSTFEAREAAAAPAARRLSQRPALAQVLSLGPAAEGSADTAAEPTLPLAELRRHLPIAARRRLPGALLRCAARHDRYLVAPGAQGARLLLGPDETGSYWELGAFALGSDADAAADDGVARRDEAELLAWPRRLAAGLRALALDIDARCEGLHVVEHVLLRPLAGAQTHPGVPLGFHALQLSVVFPAWTLRGQQPAFRVLAQETVQLNAPAHLVTHCHWLEPAPMADFEQACEAWLQARVDWAAAPADTALRDAVDRCAAALARQLVDALAAQATASAQLGADGPGA